ncbi:hypothetical protein EDB80DRAFT_337600 [Ilyonectria destructans]|nr:hypothetical protein EDB80DRAFT_337600 [Ilyonectria destructans]
MASGRVITHPSLISHVITLSCIRPVGRGFGICSFTHGLLQIQRDRIQLSSIELVACQTTSKAVPPSNYAYIGWFGKCIGVASDSPVCPRPRPVPRRPESLTPAKHLPVSSTAPLQAQRNCMDTRHITCPSLRPTACSHTGKCLVRQLLCKGSRRGVHVTSVPPSLLGRPCIHDAWCHPPGRARLLRTHIHDCGLTEQCAPPRWDDPLCFHQMTCCNS